MIMKKIIEKINFKTLLLVSILVSLSCYFIDLSTKRFLLLVVITIVVSVLRDISDYYHYERN